MRPVPAIVILAAGAATRMRGEDKLLQEVDGTPLILRAVRAACAVSPEVIVALPPASPRRAWLGDTPARVVEVADRAMSASIRAGVGSVTREAAMIHLADMPEITVREMEALSDAWAASEATILRGASADGRPGQPVIFARRHFPALMGLDGDSGAKALIAAHGTDVLRLPGEAALTDLDTPEAWEAWRARTAR
jgi:CTP:molybdopterin cytidylyltransferase MocA